MKNKNLRRLSVLVNSQTEYHLYQLAQRAGYKEIGRVIDKLVREKMIALKVWNTRPAPPIGRCGECKNWSEGDCYRQELTKADDYCSYFEPREE